MRTIKLKLLTQQDLVTIKTDVRTFAEFKNLPEVTSLDIDWSSSKLIDRTTKSSFDIEEAILPAVDSLMFVTPTKTKAGGDLPYKEVKAKIRDYKAAGNYVPFNYTQATTQELNEFWNSLSENAPVEEDSTSDVNAEDLLEAAKDSLAEAIAKLRQLNEVPSFDKSRIDKAVEEFKNSLAFYITKADLDLEAEHLSLLF